MHSSRQVAAHRETACSVQTWPNELITLDVEEATQVVLVIGHRHTHFGNIGVAVVYSLYRSPGPRLVVEHRFCDMRRCSDASVDG